MFSKASTCFNFPLTLLVALLGIGCAISNQNEKDNSYRTQISNSQPISGSFALPQQKPPPNDIQSIQLHPTGKPGFPPVLKLNGSEKLKLSFDFLGEQSRQFRIEVSHRNQQWAPSAIGPSIFLDGFYETYVQESKKSFGQRPAYHHVEFEFPDEQLQPVVSGNYLLEVYSYDNGQLLFSMPFFIAENEGSITTRVERLFAQRDDGRPLDQLFSTYKYPDFVEYPQFDLSMSFVQNQFWGRTQEAGFIDTITPGELHGHIERDNAFVGNYEFKFLDLRSFDVDGQQVLEYQPGRTPPRIILRRDVQNLDTNPRLSPTATTLGLPADDRSSDYAQVEFSLETASSIPLSSDIYIVGHFNNWMINDLNKMSYNSNEKMWKGRAFVKQGEYAYKYVLVDNNQIDDLALDQSFLSSQQEYLTFIYFRDPKRNFDRILKIDRKVMKK